MAATPVGLLSAMATEPLLQSLIITKQVTVHNPVATISCGAAQHSRSPSPTDEDLLNKAIANLASVLVEHLAAMTNPMGIKGLERGLDAWVSTVVASHVQATLDL
ncbi:hypothetical protein BDR07DRAFT_1374732 [Suillus spraguei]|nr:hypothetical protein BDR07DRAFT_1374732 [Suillus spraguei]